MARPRGQDGDVAGLESEDSTLFATEANAPLSTCDAEHLVDPGVIVPVVVDAIAPGVAPSVRFEQVLDHSRRVAALIEFDGASIDDQRPSRMIWDQFIVLEADGVGLSHLGEIRSLPLAGSPEAGGALRVFFQILKYRHDGSPLELRADSRSTVAGPSPGPLQARIR